MSELPEGPVPYVFLDLCSSVIPKAEMDAIESAPPQVMPFEYGAWVNVPPPDLMDDMKEEWEAFPNLRKVVEYARERGARYVLLDGDGLDTIPELPLFDW